MTHTFSAILRDAVEQTPEKIILTLLHNRRPTSTTAQPGAARQVPASPAETGAQSTSAAEALFEAQPLTYRELLRGAAAYARLLEDAGVKPGEVVILILQHSEALVYAFWGAVLRGAIPSIMPFLTEKLSPEHYRQALTSLFAICAPQAIITYGEFLPEVRAAVQNSGAGGTSVRVILDAQDAHQYRQAEISFDSGGLQRQAEDIVLLQHSSGTTGLQKGVALSHRAVFNHTQSYSKALSLDDADVIFSWLPLYHDMGLIAGFIMPILSGVPLVLMSPFDWVRAPYKMMHAITYYHATLTWLPNFAYNFCAQKIRQSDLQGVDLSCLRGVINCSEPVYNSSHEIFLERFRAYGLRAEALATCYAMAENVFAVTQGGIRTPLHVDAISRRGFIQQHVALPPAGDEPLLHMVSNGKPIEGVSLRILQDGTRADLPERHIGEIALRSHCMLTGYYNRPDATAEAFHQGWYLTGDLGYLADGELYVTGRKKDLIIVGGKNVYSRDLENIASEVDGVHPGRVAAFGVVNEKSGTEDVIIVAEVDEEDSARQPRIAEEVRAAIAHGSDVVVRHVHTVPRGWLLKTSSGKVSRPANREKYLAEMGASGE